MKTLAIFAATAALTVCARGEQITAEPDALLDYIEATGSQYIDTGVNAETGLKASIDFAWADEDLSGVDWSLLDACTAASSNNNRSRFFMCHMLNGKPFFAYGVKQRKNPAGAVPFVRGERCKIITDMSSTNSLELIQDGMNTFDATDRETFATNGNVNLNLNLFVFATNFGGSPSGYGQGKLYELKIFRKNATTDEFDLLRHYIPCIKDNRAGLYDKVNGTISFSSADFIAGSVTNAPPQVFKDPEGREIQDYAVLKWLSENGFTQADIDALGHDAAATDRLYECWLINLNFKVQEAGATLSFTDITVSNRVSMTVQFVRKAPLAGRINGTILIYGANDLAAGFSSSPIPDESVEYFTGDPTFNLVTASNDTVTQTAVATLNSSVTAKFFKAEIGIESHYEPEDDPWEEPIDDPVDDPVDE